MILYPYDLSFFLCLSLVLLHKNKSRHVKIATPVGLRNYATDAEKKARINQYSANITQPKSQGASQAMCK